MAPSARQRFEQSYNLPEPRAYFRLLGPLDYRQPALVSDFLRQHGPAIAAARGRKALTLIDFACGFGANGLLLKHDVPLSGLYAHYEAEPDTADVIEADRQFWAARRRRDQEDRMIGIDIAERALAYAEAVGALDEAFAVNLLSDAPPLALQQHLAVADLVIESGALGDLLAPAMVKILDHGSQPWLLLSPRGDMDARPLERLLAERGYRVDHCNSSPLRYRRFANPQERAEALAAVTALERDPNLWMDESYFKINLWLARPEPDCAKLPLKDLKVSDA